MAEGCLPELFPETRGIRPTDLKGDLSDTSQHPVHVAFNDFMVFFYDLLY